MSKSLTGKQIFKMWVDRFVSIGAAVVIIGALFKILHWKFANELLIVGMFTEAGIFLIYAIMTDTPTTTPPITETNNTLDSKELVDALKDVKTSIDDTNKNIAFISTSANGLKELEDKFATMGKTLDQLNEFYGGLKNVSETVTSSVGDAARTKDQLNTLANNLTELNAVYSNMIHAIKGK